MRLLQVDMGIPGRGGREKIYVPNIKPFNTVVGVEEQNKGIMRESRAAGAEWDVS